MTVVQLSLTTLVVLPSVLQVAVEWCLLVQELLMYVDWPEDVLCLPKSEEVRDKATNRLLLR